MKFKIDLIRKREDSETMEQLIGSVVNSYFQLHASVRVQQGAIEFTSNDDIVVVPSGAHVVVFKREKRIM